LSEKALNGNLIIVSGPSGAGKSVLACNVLKQLPNLRFSVSYTTRAPRGNERNGVEYFFVSRDEFRSLIEGKAFLEWAEVHGNYYGTSQKFVDDLLRQGEDVLLDIDVKGASIVRQKRPDAVGIFILPPSYRILKERLMRRSLDSGIVIGQRLKRACEEIGHFREYDYLIINEDVDSSTLELQSIILGARCRTELRSERAESVLDTFGGIDAEDS
jgi:guanylate kinase